MDEKPLRRRYYAVIGFTTLGFAVLRVVNGDHGIAAALGLLAVFLFAVSVRDRT